MKRGRILAIACAVAVCLGTATLLFKEKMRDKNVADEQVITINALLRSHKVELNRWYWFDHPKMDFKNRTIDMFEIDAPLMLIGESPIIGVSNHGESSKLKKFWRGALFFDCNGLVRLRHIAKIAHREYSIEETEQRELITMLDGSHAIASRKPGVYYFKDVFPGYAVELSAEDLPFLRTYYAVSLEDSAAAGKKNYAVSRMRATIQDWRIYDYYPSGRTKKVTKISASWDEESVLRRSYIYEIPFPDREQLRIMYMGRSTHQPGETERRTEDPNDPYWLDKLLRD